jgi:hypothetical protein
MAMDKYPRIPGASETTSPLSPASLPRRSIIFWASRRFAASLDRKVPQPRLEHPAGISRVRRSSEKSIAAAFPADLKQFDQQFARNSIANFDTYDSHRMAAATVRCGRHGIEVVAP